VFGYKDANNYYHMNFCGNSTNASYNGIFKVVSGTETRIATAAALLTDATLYHHVRVTWDGATGDIKAYFDQSATPVCSVNDRTQTSGQVGLWSKARQGYFDNVEVVARIRTDNFGSPVGINQAPALSLRTGWQVSPGPYASDLNALGAQLLGKTARLYDISGNLMWQWDRTGALGHGQNGLKSGMYFLACDGQPGLQRVAIIR
jgi:hypothetical protein